MKKKLLPIILLILCAKIGFAQKNFEGEIDYKIFTLSDLKKDTAISCVYKVFFGKHAIKIERFTNEGVLWEEQIMLLDSLKDVGIDHRSKMYWESWKFSESTKLPYKLSWGMNKVEVIHTDQKIAGYETYITRLTNPDKSYYGRIDLNTVKRLFFQLPPKMSMNLFFDGLLFYDNHISLGIKILPGVAPHTQMNYVATKVEAKEIDTSEFSIPTGYKLKIIKNVIFK